MVGVVVVVEGPGLGSGLEEEAEATSDWLKVNTGLLGLLRGLEHRPVDAPLTERDLWLCALESRALRGGVGDP